MNFADYGFFSTKKKAPLEKCLKTVVIGLALLQAIYFGHFQIKHDLGQVMYS
jgi:hypothetical protein